MPFIRTEDGARLYYEVHGQGEPVIFLNGIMMSALSWKDLIPAVASTFRLILLDFRDQGNSSRMAEQYDLDVHVGDVLQLVDELQIPKAHVMGLSYGGDVALKFALAHQDRLKTLILANAMSYVSPHLREIGQAWEVAAELDDGAKFFQLATPFIYSATFYQTHSDLLRERQEAFGALLTREWFEGFVRLVRSTSKYYVAPQEMQQIKVPTLLIGAEQDIVAPVREMMVIYENVSGCEFVVIPQAGHGAFLEKSSEFLTAVIGFVAKHEAGNAAP
ncbi:MAG: alpha/beta hydrolase [Chloroflexi bacterium]|nr:alpha/beta hydrolase [Chloroflexota bacterium]MDA8189690.1 alpha/beta hydrolase [Dehalococcoidales bacterium]